MENKSSEWVSLCPLQTTCPEANFSLDVITLREQGVNFFLRVEHLKVLVEEARKRGFVIG